MDDLDLVAHAALGEGGDVPARRQRTPAARAGRQMGVSAMLVIAGHVHATSQP